MVKKHADIRDLRIDAHIGEKGRRYRATHIPSGVFTESEPVAEAVQRINDDLDGKS